MLMNAYIVIERRLSDIKGTLSEEREFKNIQ